MTQVQYIGDGHTSISLSPREPKVKVANGEIVEVTGISDKYLVLAGFQVVKGVETKVTDDGEEAVTIKVNKKAKK